MSHLVISLSSSQQEFLRAAFGNASSLPGPRYDDLKEEFSCESATSHKLLSIPFAIVGPDLATSTVTRMVEGSPCSPIPEELARELFNLPAGFAVPKSTATSGRRLVKM